jgi:hypothetical protein
MIYLHSRILAACVFSKLYAKEIEPLYDFSFEAGSKIGQNSIGN